MRVVSDMVSAKVKGWRAIRQKVKVRAVLLPFTFCLLPYIVLQTSAWACPGCKDALVDPAQVGTRLGMARGFAWSIGLLLAMPATLIGAVTLRVVWAARQRKEG